MLRRALLVVDVRCPGGADEGLRGIEPGIEEQRPDQRLDDVADDIVALRGAVLAGLLAEPDVGGNTERPADLGAGLARHQGVESL